MLNKQTVFLFFVCDLVKVRWINIYFLSDDWGHVIYLFWALLY